MTTAQKLRSLARAARRKDAAVALSPDAVDALAWLVDDSAFLLARDAPRQP